EFGGAAGLGAGVEVVDGPAGDELEGMLLGSVLVRRDVLGRLDDGLALGVEGAVLVAVHASPGHQVPSVALAQVGVGPGDAVGVQARGAVRGVVGAGPLDAAAVAEFLVAEPGVVAGASGAAPLPGGEGGLGVVPADQGGAVLVAEVHAGREVEQDVEVGPRLAGRFDRLVGQVHGAV